MAITTHQAIIKQTESLDSQKFDIADYQITLVFGSRYTFEDKNITQKLLSSSSPDHHVIMCSTSGQIADTLVYDDELVMTGISFEHTDIQIAKTKITKTEDSFEIGKKLAEELPKEDLVHVLIFSDGHITNGGELVKGFNEILRDSVKVTGGMAGDAARFQRTLVGHNESPELGNIVALGLYGDRLEVAYAYSGGFDPFGPYRKVTKSKSNVLYELDGKNALNLYKTYLGDLASELPGSALFFPLSITLPGSDIPLVRTILSVDEATNSMTFAGDVPEGCTARLMRSNIEHVVDAAEDAAKKCLNTHTNQAAPQLALLISCVGRKLILDQRVEEETEAVKEIFGDTTITGFYSYGEICPSNKGNNQYADLHNQTMTITTFSEL